MLTSNLSVYSILFHLNADTTLHLGTQAGAQFRGALWKQLQDLACTNPNQQSDPLHSRHCPACFLLTLEVPSARGINPPRPFTIRPPLAVRAEDDRSFRTGEDLQLGINIFGFAINLLPYIAQAIQQIGREGVGYGRGRFSIQSIDHVNPLTGATRSLLKDGKLQQAEYGMFDAVIEDYVSHINTKQIRLRFLTPTQITQDSKIIERPQFMPIMARLLERIEAISLHYTETDASAWGDSYQSLIEQAKHIKIVQDNTRWIDVKSGSRRANRLQDISGFVGEVLFEGDLKPFLAYLVWGASLHVGKNAVKGNGWYEIAT